MGQGLVRLDRLEVFVLDELTACSTWASSTMSASHRGPAEAAPVPVLSATMLPEVVRLAGSILSHPVKIEAHPVASTVELVEERVMFVDKAAKLTLLGQVLKDGVVGRAPVFTRTKHGADRVVR